MGGVLESLEGVFEVFVRKGGGGGARGEGKRRKEGGRRGKGGRRTRGRNGEGEGEGI